MYSNLKFSKTFEKKLPENSFVSKILSTNIAQPLQNHSGLQCCIMHLYFNYKNYTRYPN